jgi:hypothetical protein
MAAKIRLDRFGPARIISWQRARAAGDETGWWLVEALIAACQAWEAEGRAMMEGEGEVPMYWRGAPG